MDTTMDTTPLPTPAPTRRTPRPKPFADEPVTLRDVFRQGIDSVFKAQSIMLDMAAEQNKIIFSAARERLKPERESPVSNVLNLFEQTGTNWVEVQRSFLNIRKPRSEKPREERRPFPSLPVGRLTRRTIDGFIEANRELLGLAEKQARLAIETAAEFSMSAPRHSLREMSAATRDSVENLLEAQERLLMLGAKQGKAAMDDLSESERAVISRTLAGQAKKAIDAFVDAQKRILDLAENLNESSFKALIPADSEEAPARTKEESKIANFAREALDRFIKTQEDLLDLAEERSRKIA